MSTKSYNHAQKNFYHDNKSLSEPGDVYDHLYNVSKPIHITVYRNGDPFDAGVNIPVTRNQFKNWLTFLDYLTERLQLPDGAVHNVYTIGGEEIRHFKHLKQGGVYVGAKGEFRESNYGGKDTRRMKWQIRHASAKPDPTTVMSKESREIYLEQKGFRPKLDDVWDDNNFDRKYASVKTSQTLAKNHQLLGKNVSHKLTPNSPRKENVQLKNANLKSTPINKTHLKDNAYRIQDQGRAATNKSRFPPIHTGSLVEMNKKAKLEKENKTRSVRNRSNSAPETLKQMQNKKYVESSRSTKSNLSEPKNFNSQQKNATSTSKVGKNANLKPPGGKTQVDTKKKKVISRSPSPATKKNFNNNSLLPVSNKGSELRSRKDNSQTRDKRSKSQDRSTTPQINQKRNKSLENDAQSLYSKGRTRRASNYEEVYNDRNRNEEYERVDEYDEERRNLRDDDEYYDEERRDDDEYEYENSPRNIRNSYQDDEYGKEASMRLRTSSYREPEYEKDEYGDYNATRDYYDEPKYFEEENRGYVEEDEYNRKSTPKPAATRNKKRSETKENLPETTSINTSSNTIADDEHLPKWANNLTVAVRDLASEVHSLSDFKK